MRERVSSIHAGRESVFEVVGRPTVEGVTWVRANPDLDIATATRARADLAGLFVDDRASGFVLVYRASERFVGVRGLRLLLEGAEQVRCRGGDLVVVSPPRCLQRMLPLVAKLAGLLYRERRRRGTRRNSRALSCWRQALLSLVWFRKNEEMTTLAAGFGISRATGYRYRDEVVTVVSAQAPDLHAALEQVAEHGWSHVVLDGTVIRTDRCAETTVSTKGETINAWYSGCEDQSASPWSAV